MRTSTLAICLAMLHCCAAGAQTFANAREGQAVIGACYAACEAQAADLDRERIRLSTTRWVELLTNEFPYDIYDMPADRFIAGVMNAENCRFLQQRLVSMAACDRGCRDLEAAYGSHTSIARNAFKELLQESRNALADAGLWNDGPTRISRFGRSCDDWSTSAVQESGSADTPPAITRQRTAPAP